MYRYGFSLSYVRVRNRVAWQWALVIIDERDVGCRRCHGKSYGIAILIPEKLTFGRSGWSDDLIGIFNIATKEMHHRPCTSPRSCR